jgi:alanine racemase
MTMTMEMFRRTFAEINIENLVHNWQLIAQAAGDDRFVCPMVKANAYGHGDVPVAQALEKNNVRNFGVCLIEEGLLLRANGIKSDIYVFRGFDRHGAQKMLECQLTPIVSSWEHLEALSAVADEPVKVHLKFDTGMNRLGFDVSQTEKLAEYFKKSKKLKLKAVLTHLSSGEDAVSDNGASAEQIKKFLPVVDFFRPFDAYAHLLNSGGIASLVQVSQQKTSEPGPTGLAKNLLQQYPWGFRPGLMLYGYQPAESFSELPLRPVMSLKSVVNNIRSVKTGEGVSYGSTWKASRPSQIAVVPVGYADGVHRLISNRGRVLFAGQLVPVVGRVCMDFLMLDVTDVVTGQDSKKYLEEEVIIFGFDEKNNFLSARQQAEATETIVWETLTSVGERVPRHFKGLKKI